jgi:hypothetical protein
MKYTLLIATILSSAATLCCAQSAGVPGAATGTTQAAPRLAPPPVASNALPAAGVTAAVPSPALPTHSNITPVQLQNINRLDYELGGLGLLSRVGVDQQRSLMDTLEAAPIATVRPSAQAISKLGATLTTVVPTLRLSAAQRRQLAIDVNMALNSGNLSPTQAERVIADARSLLQMTFVRNPQGVEQLMGDLSLLVAQVQGSLVQPTPQTTPQVVAGGESAPGGAQTGQAPGPETGAGAGSSNSEPPTR